MGGLKDEEENYDGDDDDDDEVGVWWETLNYQLSKFPGSPFFLWLESSTAM